MEIQTLHSLFEERALARGCVVVSVACATLPSVKVLTDGHGEYMSRYISMARTLSTLL
jgi:hypothetical protein